MLQLEPIPPNWSMPLQSTGSLHSDGNGDFIPDRAGAEVLVAGRVSAGTGLIRGDLAEIYIQDGTGGLRLVLPPGSAPVLSGDSLLVHGRATFRYGMQEMLAPNIKGPHVDSVASGRLSDCGRRAACRSSRHGGR